jgi:hypothetical protein
LGCKVHKEKVESAAHGPSSAWHPLADMVLPFTLDLRAPIDLAAQAVVRRLDPAMDYRPWFLLRGRGGIPVAPEHASWDLGDMTGRYLEGLILARRMGVSRPEFCEAEGRLGRYLLKLLGPDGLVHDPDSGKVDHAFSQGSALYGLVTWFEDSGDPAVRAAIERLISGLLRRVERQGDQLVDSTVKLPESCGSHLVGYQIYPAIRFYELTGYPEAMTLAEGLTQWVLNDPVLGADGAITKALSWEGHIHSWLDALAGCTRAARNSPRLDRQKIIARCRAVYDWVRRTNATDFGWIATFPTHGSSETCAISSAIRLALELAASGYPEYLDDVERFVRNQVVEAQFRDLNAYSGGPEQPSPLLVGCFDSQSMPNGHLGTRGGEDVGTVEGCCLNGGMRALASAWGAIQTSDESGISVHLAISMNGPAGQVIGYQPIEGRVDVISRVPGAVRVRVPPWVQPKDIQVFVAGKSLKPENNAPAGWAFAKSYVVLDSAPAKARVSVRYPLRELEQNITVGGQKFRVCWKGDVVVGMDPPGQREPTYQGRLPRMAAPQLRRAQNERKHPSTRGGTNLVEGQSSPPFLVPDTYELQDAARLAAMSMLARLDLQRGGQPFFRIYPFASPPRAEHEKWDDGDMTGRYVEALIAARRMTGIPLDPRENLLRSYLAGLFDPVDGLAYARQSAWTPRRACLFSQSCAMLGLLAWHQETGSLKARRLLDQHVNGLMRIAVDRDTYAYFPKYEYDGSRFIDDPPNKDAPTWYGGRLILPLVEYWKLTGSNQVRVFIEKLIRYSTEVSRGIKPDGEVLGNGWWGHLHSTMDMATGIAEFGRLTGRPEWVAWAKRVYDWIGRTHTTRYGWVADCSGSHICESCAVASRIRLGLALCRAGLADPFGEIDRHLRNQLLENQFVNLDFLQPLAPDTPRTDKTSYAGVDRMIRGTFQCWGTPNDLIGHDDIEGCGAGGGVQALALAWNAQAEWHKATNGNELRIHLLFNRRIRKPAEPPLIQGAPIACELWSCLPWEGRVLVQAHEPIPRLALRLPDGAEPNGARLRRLPRAGAPDFAPRSPNMQLPQRDPRRNDEAASPFTGGAGEIAVKLEGQYVVVPEVGTGETIELTFPLREYETVETAKGIAYRARWKGSWVLAIDPPGKKMPLYADRARLHGKSGPLSAPRYP